MLTWFPSHRAAARRRSTPSRRSTDDRGVLARLGRPVPPRRRLPRRDPPVAAGAEGAHVRADRRDRRGADDLAAGADRRRAQLGLPLLLAPRRDADAARDAERRLRARRPRPGASGCCARWRAIPPTSRSCTGSRASGGSTSASSSGCPGTRTRRRCGSATPRRRSSSSTSTARCSTPLYQTRRRTAAPPDDNGWALTRKLLEWLEDGWRRAGRRASGRCAARTRHFTHSKVMAWVAFDRAVRLCEEFGLRGPVDRWRALRDEIHAEVLARAWNERAAGVHAVLRLATSSTRACC